MGGMVPGQGDDPRPYELAIEEGRRALDGQDEQIKASRDRVISLLGFGGVSAAFFGGFSTVSGSTPSVWAAVALFGFVAQAVITVAVLRPRKLEPGMSAAKMVQIADRDDATHTALARDIALALSAAYDKNNHVRVRLTMLTTAAMGCFLVSLYALAFALLLR